MDFAGERLAYYQKTKEPYVNIEIGIDDHIWTIGQSRRRSDRRLRK